MIREDISWSDVRWHIQSELLEISSPYNDGFTSWERKKKLYELQWLLDSAMETLPTYVGEDEWVQEQKVQQAFSKLSKSR